MDEPSSDDEAAAEWLARIRLDLDRKRAARKAGKGRKGPEQEEEEDPWRTRKDLQ